MIERVKSKIYKKEQTIMCYKDIIKKVALKGNSKRNFPFLMPRTLRR